MPTTPSVPPSEIYERVGVDLDRSTLADLGGRNRAVLLAASGRRAAPLRAAASKLHAGRIRRSGARRRSGQNKTGRLLDLRPRRPGHAAIPLLRRSGFAFSPTPGRAPAAPSEDFAARCKPTHSLVSNALYERRRTQHPRGCLLGACPAQFTICSRRTPRRSRRKLCVASANCTQLKARSATAAPDQRRQVLNSHPAAARFHDDWLQSTLRQAGRKKSPVTVAIGYALGLWTALLRFCDDGQWRSTIMPRARLCARSLSDAKTTYLRGPIPRRPRSLDLQLIGTAKLNGSRPGSLPPRTCSRASRSLDQPHR